SSGVPLRIEVEPALPVPAREVGADVTDEEPVPESAPTELHAQPLTHLVTPRTHAGDGVGGAQRHPPLGCFAGQFDVIVVLDDVVDAVAPADVDQGRRGDPFVQDLLGTALGDV